MSASAVLRRKSVLLKMPLLRADKNFREIQDLILLKNREKEDVKEVKDEVLGNKKDRQNANNLGNEQTTLSQARHFIRMRELEKGFMYINKAMVVGGSQQR